MAEETKKTEKTAVKSKEDTGNAYQILVKPLVTEKGYRHIAQGKYSFKVSPKANKISVRKAVEVVYDVKVADVNMVTVKGKSRTFGKARGRTSDWKKAVVTLKKGEVIAGAQA